MWQWDLVKAVNSLDNALEYVLMLLWMQEVLSIVESPRTALNLECYFYMLSVGLFRVSLAL